MKLFGVNITNTIRAPPERAVGKHPALGAPYTQNGPSIAQLIEDGVLPAPRRLKVDSAETQVEEAAP